MKKTLFGIMALAIAFTFGTMMSCSEKVEEEQPMTVAQINDSIASLVDSTVYFEGTVEHFCPCKGIILTDATFGCRIEGEFNDSLMNQNVRIRGIVRTEVRDTTFYQTKLAEFLAAQQPDTTAAAEAQPEVAENAEPAAEEATCCKKEGEGCGMDSAKIAAKIDEIRVNGPETIYYIEVTSVEKAPVAEAEAK